LLQVVNLSTLQYKGILSLSMLTTTGVFLSPRDKFNVLVHFFSKINAKT
jgi:hypothetical protein